MIAPPDRAVNADPRPTFKPKAAFFPLGIEVDGGCLVVGSPRSLYRKRGLLAILALPVLFWLLLLLVFVGTVDQSSEDIEIGFTAVGVALSALSVGAGLCLVLGAGALSRRTRFRFDRARRTVRRERDGREVPWDAIGRVRARPLDGPLKFWAIELVGKDGAVVMPIHERLAELHGPDIEAIAASIRACLGDAGYRSADAVGVEIPVVPRADGLGLAPNTAAMLCYLPVHGIFLIASIYYAITAKDRPFIRFAALQSLIQTAASTAAVIAFGIVAGVPAALLDDSPARVGALAILVVGIVGIALGNIGVHIYAAVQANSGKTWVMPWLRPIVQRWAPPPGPPR